MRFNSQAIRRFMGRSIDYLWFTFVFEFAFSWTNLSEAVIFWVAWMVFIPIESAFLLFWGSTPGKFIFRLRAESIDNSAITYKQTISRSFSVWVYGLWMCILFFPIISALIAYRNLDEFGSTVWDRSSGIRIR